MKSIKILALIFWITAIAAHNPNTAEYYYQVSLNDGTKVIINGSSNVNDFKCAYQTNINDKSFCIYGKMNGLIMNLKNALFNLEVNNFDCGNPLMTSDFKSTLKKDKFPEISMEITAIDFVKTANIDSPSSVVFANINVCAAGQNKSYCIKTNRNLIGSGVKFTGDFDIEVSDFGIEPPVHAFGLIKVNPTMNIEFSFVFNGSRS